MCGIVGYLGYRDAYPILIKGLARLEYRGYDSAGVGVIDTTGKLKVYKKTGKVSKLEEHIADQDTVGQLGIGHSRWATHGVPSDDNAHPHLSESGDLALVHNGIIENYASIKSELIARGHHFVSDTDSEVLVHLIEEIRNTEGCTLQEAVRLSLSQIIGAYAIVLIDRKNDRELVAARKGSPLVIGIGEGEFFIGSDASPLIEYTKNVIYLNDLEVAHVKDGKLSIKTIDNSTSTPHIQELEMKLETIEKGGYDYFMLKEIHEQPRSIRDCMRGRIYPEKGRVTLGGLKDYREKLQQAERIIFIACGTSWHAALVGEYLIEDFARISVEVEYASEFRYRNPVIGKQDIVIAISQSGETADTLAAMELAKEKGATVLGICNVVGSSIPRISHAGIYIHAGPEIGVASTKAFTAQVTALTLFAFHLSQLKDTLSQDKLIALLTELDHIPHLVERCLQLDEATRFIAGEIKNSNNCIFLGRGTGFPIALEGALKLKEISYIHAEGYPAAEMKHGPIALIDEDMPVVVIATQNSSYEKVISNIQEIKARRGKIIAIVTEGDTVVRELADYLLEIPQADDTFLPLLASIPLQLLSYHTALLRGCNVDQPRNLAKSVTVE